MSDSPRVWAPTAKRVELIVRGKSAPLVREANGWWSGPGNGLSAGDDYQFRLDDGPRLADPRSPWQPRGVFGPSRAVDHTAFRWTDERWRGRPFADAIIYEIHVGTFTPEGTFDAAIGRLDYLVDLGVTHLEIMPVAEFLGEYGWGYDGVFPFAPHHSYGGPDGLKRLVDACHTRGLAVLLDVVYNHLGPAGNVLPRFGPYFANWYHTPWGEAINFDGPGSDETRRYFCDNALMWLRDYHCDGLRLDAVHAIRDGSAVPFLEQLATEVAELSASLGRPLVVTSESDLNDPRLVLSPKAGGYGHDAAWADDLHHAVHVALTGEHTGYYADFRGIARLAQALASPFVYAGEYSPFRDRRHGRQPDGVPPEQFIVCLQNHDQIGNRAQGERISHLVSAERAKIGAALILLSPYTPLLFQGEEWAASAPFQYFVDFHEETSLANAVSAGRRREFAAFGWRPDDVPDPSDRRTFERSKLDWSELEAGDHRAMLDWYRALIALRCELGKNAAFRSATSKITNDDRERWMSIERGPATIVCNFDSAEHAAPLVAGDDYRVRLESKPPVTIERTRIVLPAESVIVLMRETA